VGFIRTFPHVLAYGPLKYGGLAIPNLYMEQLVEQLGVLLQYRDQMSDTTGLLI